MGLRRGRGHDSSVRGGLLSVGPDDLRAVGWGFWMGVVGPRRGGVGGFLAGICKFAGSFPCVGRFLETKKSSAIFWHCNLGNF